VRPRGDIVAGIGHPLHLCNGARAGSDHRFSEDFSGRAVHGKKSRDP